MNEEPDTHEAAEEASSEAPRGAIFVTTFLTVVILVFWFGTYILGVVRG